MQLYTATKYKKDELLGPGGISKEFYDYKVDGVHSWLDYCDANLLEQAYFIYRKEGEDFADSNFDL